MTRQNLRHCLPFCAIALLTNVTFARAQATEIVGSRALGMGGAFVAVATDSSATWWNPAALAAGPFLDISLARARTESRGLLPAHRDTATWFALGTPPFGFSYYRLQITNIEPPSEPSDAQLHSTVTESGSREHRRAGVPVRSLAASQFGITLVQTLLPGVHAGATLKYLRGTVRSGFEDEALAIDALLDRGDGLEGGESDAAFGVDLGFIGVAGAVRAGLLVRNAVESEFEHQAGTVRLERQFRVGVAYDGRPVRGPALVVAVDADVSTTRDASGDRRNVAVGVEHWALRDRLGLRGGARFNTVGAQQRAATGGISVAVRAGLFVDGHVVRGGEEDDRGWGIAARVSF